MYVCVSILLLRAVYLRQCQLVTKLIKHSRAQLLAAIYLHIQTHTPLTCTHALLVMAQLHLQLKVKDTFCVFWTRLHFDLWLRNILRKFPIFFYIFWVPT